MPIRKERTQTVYKKRDVDDKLDWIIPQCSQNITYNSGLVQGDKHKLTSWIIKNRFQ